MSAKPIADPYASHDPDGNEECVADEEWARAKRVAESALQRPVNNGLGVLINSIEAKELASTVLDLLADRAAAPVSVERSGGTDE